MVTDKNKEELAKMDKKMSSSRAVARLIFGFFAFIVWLLLGVPPTLIYASGIQTFIGTFTFFTRNPIVFLLIAILNILVGVVSYFTIKIEWFTAFHLLWSIRWFYGYNKYRHLKNNINSIG